MSTSQIDRLEQKHLLELAESGGDLPAPVRLAVRAGLLALGSAGGAGALADAAESWEKSAEALADPGAILAAAQTYRASRVSAAARARINEWISACDASDALQAGVGADVLRACAQEASQDAIVASSRKSAAADSSSSAWAGPGGAELNVWPSPPKSASSGRQLDPKLERANAAASVKEQIARAQEEVRLLRQLEKTSAAELAREEKRKVKEAKHRQVVEELQAAKTNAALLREEQQGRQKEDDKDVLEQGRETAEFKRQARKQAAEAEQSHLKERMEQGKVVTEWVERTGKDDVLSDRQAILQREETYAHIRKHNKEEEKKAVEAGKNDRAEAEALALADTLRQLQQERARLQRNVDMHDQRGRANVRTDRFIGF